METNRIVTAALVGGLTIGAVSTGFVVAQVFSNSGHNYAGQYQNAAQQSPGPSSGMNGAPAASSPSPMPSSMGPMTSMTPSAPANSNVFTDSSLAEFIAKKAGTSLAGRSPQSVPASQAGPLSDQVPAAASIDRQSNTIIFRTSTVSFTVVAIAPDKPDMTFVVAGLANPSIVVPQGARVTVRFVNNDTDEAHGWLITSHKPPFQFGQPDTPAIAGADSGVIGDPVAGNDGANTISFTATSPGSYEYICPMPGHAQMGMDGVFTVG